jgi:Mn2+/Fe2+ NRAMP family transporter
VLSTPKKKSAGLTLAAIGPGLLLAATGVGGGDLATGSFVGSIVGTIVLWAVVVGAFMKFVVTEGLARWQLATGDSFLEGLAHHFGPGVIWAFLPYLFLWSFFAGSAQISACGVAMHAIFPVFGDATQGKIFFGALSSLVGLGLVLRGGYRLFEKIMRGCIAIMFVTVVWTALALWPGTGEIQACATLHSRRRKDSSTPFWSEYRHETKNNDCRRHRRVRLASAVFCCQRSGESAVGRRRYGDRNLRRGRERRGDPTYPGRV